MPDAPTQPVTLITAAGRGIGAACARELAERGHRLALLSPSGAETVRLELETAGTEVVAVAGSVTEPDDLQHLVDAAIEHWGQIDSVVANTGHPPKGELLELDDQAWHDGLDMVLLHTVRLARLVTPIFVRQERGAMVNISTFSAFEPELAFPISSCLRAALGGFAKLWSDRYAGHGLRMNNVLPGFVDSYPESPETLARIPAGRYGQVEELARTVAFLLSTDAGYVTGQNLRVDGGLTRSV